MLALSIRQPWASLIIKAGKDIENRDWPTRVRGRILVHAAKGMTQGEWREAMHFAHWGDPRLGQSRLDGFGMAEVPRGGFVGTVEIVDCVQESASPWFMGRYGFVLRDPQPMEFVPWKGQLGFFSVTDQALQAARDGDGHA